MHKLLHLPGLNNLHHVRMTEADNANNFCVTTAQMYR